MKQETVTVTETVTETALLDETLVDENGVLLEEPDEEAKGVTLPLKRTAYKVDGNTYYYFHVSIVVFGKEMKLELRPKQDDRNAYFMLQGIFGEGNETLLHCTQGSRIQQGTNKRQKYMIYTVKGYDSLIGEVSVALVPYGDTSKRTLEALYQRKAAELN